MPSATPSEARIKAAIGATQAMDLPISEVRVERDGTLRILVSGEKTDLRSSEGGPSCDELFGVSG